MFDRGHDVRITKLEDRFTAMDERLEGVESAVGGLGGKIDKLVGELTNTDGRAAERAQAVKGEIRDENDRKAKERFSLLSAGGGLITVVVLIVAAFCGPYLSRLDATSKGQADDTFRIGQVRETLSMQGADIARDHDALEIVRDRNHIQDAELREHDRDIAHMQGWLEGRKSMPSR
jgi:hypothetical protein